jgi:hypothetical protein
MLIDLSRVRVSGPNAHWPRQLQLLATNTFRYQYITAIRINVLNLDGLFSQSAPSPSQPVENPAFGLLADRLYIGGSPASIWGIAMEAKNNGRGCARGRC